jgi:ribosomal protein S13
MSNLLNQSFRQKVVYALTKIKGVGRRYSNLVWYEAASLSHRWDFTSDRFYGIAKRRMSI